MKYHSEPMLPGKLRQSSSIAGSTNQKLILEFYHVIKTEINSKKIARLPFNDRRRIVALPKTQTKVFTILNSKTTFEPFSLKKYFGAFFSSQLKMTGSE